MRRIFWDRFTQSLLPPPGPTTPPAATSVTGSSKSSDVTSSGGGSGSGGGGGDVSDDQAEIPVVEIPGLPPLRVGSKVHARYGSERGSYYAATVVAVGGANSAAGGAGAGVCVDVRYDEDGMVERGVPASRLKKSDDPPDFGPLLALLGEVCSRFMRCPYLQKRRFVFL